ncbi:MAG: hypothetical protein IJC63_06035 [Myxococcaceae bacterium]|nr:hypothetical protein [Myxococcaceae bacterium]
MPDEQAPSTPALDLFLSLLNGGQTPGDQLDIVRAFLRQRAAVEVALNGEVGAAAIFVSGGSDDSAANAPDLLMTAPIDTRHDSGRADLSAMAALFADLAQATARLSRAPRLAFLAFEEDAAGAQKSVRAIAVEHPELLKARAILTPSRDGTIERQGVRLLPIATAFKGRAIVELAATGARLNAGHTSTASAAYRLTRALLRLANQGLPLHASPQAKSMFKAMRRRFDAPAYLRALASGKLLAGMALDSLDADDPLAAPCAAALHNTAAPIALTLADPHAPGLIPDQGRALLDCRRLPEQTTSALLLELRACLDDDQLTLTARDELTAACETPPAPILDAIERALIGLSDDLCPLPHWFSAHAPDAAFLARAGAPLVGLPFVGDPNGDSAAQSLWTRALSALSEALPTALDSPSV